MGNTLKKEKGITLIALVITIIILLILAGISIASLTGSGLFEKAKDAKTETLKADSKERIQLEVFASYGNDGKLDLEKLKDNINKSIPEANIIGDEFPITVTINKDTFEVDEKGNVTLVGPQAQITEAKVVENSNGTGEAIIANSQKDNKELYISFKANIEGGTIKSVTCDKGNVNLIDERYVTPINSNGTYKFTIIVTVDGEDYKTIYTYTVTVYEVYAGYVKYDAGDWTQEEIEELENNYLYDINKNRNINATYKLKDSNGLNFTFGGFTYKEDNANKESIEDRTIVTNRNQSVLSASGVDASSYDGWKIAECESKNGKIYISKLVHAGSPETFVFSFGTQFDGARATTLLSGKWAEVENGKYEKLADGTKINRRNIKKLNLNVE